MLTQIDGHKTVSENSSARERTGERGKEREREREREGGGMYRDKE